ncbi:heterokaryon incompatibility protein-domain-containing protein [Xylaria longipes]|nr:heterokaryon incompatibility protein-domain-containing protein [Xylaria longipes]
MTSNRPPTSNQASELMRVVQPMVASCLSSHTSCNESIGGESISRDGTKLPTRIIQVNVDNNRNMVKVIEHSRRIARYCALSHCWGPRDKQPFKTNRSNLGEVVRGISIDTLPKTFQDAIEVTRAMGVEYLWVDSICIVQDVKQDWLQQSEQMGEIYERAFIVIAAAGSSDSTGGLLNIPRHPELTAEFPFFHLGDERAGTFMITMCSHLQFRPAFGPLIKRGWVTQELLLGRRILFFMPGGMSWMCKKAELTEAGNDYDLRTDFPLPHWDSTQEWLWFVYIYSGTQLSIPTDRLIAIQGIANELQKRRADRYHLGLWTKDLEQQLIWLADDYSPAEEISQLPSWCWASLGGSKDFLFSLRRSGLDLSRILVNISLDRRFSTLAGQYCLRRAFLNTECWPIHDRCLFELLQIFDQDQHGLSHEIVQDNYRAELRILRNDRLNGPRASVFELFDEHGNFNTIGLTTFDKEVCSNIFILPLISIPRETSSMAYHEPDDEPYEAPWKPEAHETTPTCIDLAAIAPGTHIEWALLLTPVDEQEMRFKRVGVALLYPHRMRPNTGRPVTFQIE